MYKCSPAKTSHAENIFTKKVLKYTFVPDSATHQMITKDLTFSYAADKCLMKNMGVRGFIC